MSAALAGVPVLSAVLTPTVCVNDASAGTVNWSTPENATSTSAFAEVPLNPTVTSRYLYCHTCGWSAIPEKARIVGAEVSYDRQAAVGLLATTTAALRLTNSTLLSRVESAVAWLLTIVGKFLGAPGDEWGGSLNADLVRGNAFGAMISVRNGGILPETFRIRNVRITVYYQTPNNSVEVML